MIPREERAEKLNQKPAMVLITGIKDAGKKPMAKELERLLFNAGRNVYFLGIGNLLYGVDADLKGKEQHFREEHVRRLSEVAHLMLEAGVILIVTAVEITRADQRIMSAVLNGAELHTVWIGNEVSTDVLLDVHLKQREPESGARKLKRYLQDQGIIFKPV